MAQIVLNIPTAYVLRLLTAIKEMWPIPKIDIPDDLVG